MKGKKGLLKTNYLGWVVVAVLLLLWRQFGPGIPTDVGLGNGAISEAYSRQQSGLMVEFEAQVQRVLKDDTEGSQHQRLILQLSNGHTLLLAHNIDLAERVPVDQWDTVRVRGEYEWNAQGGVVHWTHRDPGMGIKHGWVEHHGVRYE